MQIEIVYDARDRLSDITNGNRIKLALTYKKRYFWALMLVTIGILSLLVGLRDNDFFFLGLGATFVIFFCFFIYRMLRDRAKIIIKNEGELKRLAEKVGVITATFGDDLFTFRDNEVYYELKWSNFSGYLITGDFLFLIMNNKIMSSFGMHINVFKPQQLKEIVDFLHSRIPLYSNKGLIWR